MPMNDGNSVPRMTAVVRNIQIKMHFIVEIAKCYWSEGLVMYDIHTSVEIKLHRKTFKTGLYVLIHH